MCNMTEKKHIGEITPGMMENADMGLAEIEDRAQFSRIQALNNLSKDYYEIHNHDYLYNLKEERYRQTEEAERVKINSVAPVNTRAESKYQRKKRQQREQRLTEQIANAQRLREEVEEAQSKSQKVKKAGTEEETDALQEMQSQIQNDKDMLAQIVNKERVVLDKKIAAIKEQEKARLMIAEELNLRRYNVRTQDRRESSMPLADAEELNLRGYNVGTRTPENEFDMSLVDVEKMEKTNAHSYYDMVTGGDDEENLAQDYRILDRKIIDQRRKMRIQIDSLDQQIKALDDYNALLGDGSKERPAIVERREAAIVERYRLQKKREILGMKPKENGKPSESRKRAEIELQRFEKNVKNRAVLHKRNKMTEAGMRYLDPATKHVLINMGYAEMSGSTPMYIYKDMNSGKEYLFRAAISKSGAPMPEKACAAAAASNVEKSICGENESVSTYVVKDGDTILGSMQEIVRPYNYILERMIESEYRKVKMSDWQLRREANPEWMERDKQWGLQTEDKDALLRQHLVDWLCFNFETKGGDFVRNENGELRACDKSAAFSHIEDAKDMNIMEAMQNLGKDSIYYRFFTDYANAKMTLAPESIQQIDAYIDNIQNMDTNDYLNMFKEMLDEKYGTGDKRQEIENIFLERRRKLKEDYSNFFRNLRQGG